jgi:hypothetical protein
MTEQFEKANPATKPACDPHGGLLKDCNLSGPTAGARGTSAETSPPGAGATAGKRGTVEATVQDGVAVPNVNGVTEAQFMKTAPAVMRHELHLPKDATSKQLVDTMLKDEIAYFKTEKPSVERAQLKLFGLDDKQVNHFMHDKNSPTYDQELAAAWLKQTKQFMDVPGPATEATYKKIEDKWLRQQYKTALDVEKIHNFAIDKD